MSKDAILGAIRRGLRRGELPADQTMGLRARLDAHPRHLIPARSRVPRPEQVALFIRNLEKEFATYSRVEDKSGIPAAVADYIAAQNLPSEFAMAPHAELQDIPWDSRPLLTRREGRASASDPARPNRTPLPRRLPMARRGVATGAFPLPFGSSQVRWMPVNDPSSLRTAAINAGNALGVPGGSSVSAQYQQLGWNRSEPHSRRLMMPR